MRAAGWPPNRPSASARDVWQWIRTCQPSASSASATDAPMRLAAPVTTAVRDPSVAALLIAKASQADEVGVALRIAPESSLPVLDDELSTDVTTVVGNLVDNAMEAAAEAPQRWVEVSLGLVDGEVDAECRMILLALLLPKPQGDD